jgi:hypothetical protein
MPRHPTLFSIVMILLVLCASGILGGAGVAYVDVKANSDTRPRLGMDFVFLA